MRTQAQVLHIQAGAHICPPVLSHIPLIFIAVDLLYVAHRERSLGGGLRRMQWCPCYARDSVWLAVLESYGSRGATVMEVERLWQS